MNQNFTQYAFTPPVKQIQEENGSRRSYSRTETSGDRYILTDEENSFIESRDSFYMGTVGENGWPYVQHRGGPIGFLTVIDQHTLAMADYTGNRQYISTGNINSNQKVSLFLIDYPNRRRLKIWAEAKIVKTTDDSSLLKRVSDSTYTATIERLMIFTVKAFDWNCSQHITPRYTMEDITDNKGEEWIE